MALVIFTDLDGTLLDEAYSFRAAGPALALLKRTAVPLVICSSKTRREIEYYREKLGCADPFVCENGGAVYVPKGYFGFPVAGRPMPEAGGPAPVVREEDGYEAVHLGAPYGELRSVMGLWRRKGYRVTGFGDMSAEEVAALTGLPRDLAVMAKEREFDEPFLFRGNGRIFGEIARSARRAGLRVIRGGLLCHLMGRGHKGKGVTTVRRLFRESLGGDVIFAALGDGPGDLPMLLAVDLPIMVQRVDGTYERSLAARGFIEAGGIGPAGWNRAVLDLLRREGPARP